MRYCGSKARFMKELAPILSEHLNGTNTFVDAFMGGANVISYIDYYKKVGIELNKYVYALWNEVLTNSKIGINPEHWVPETITRKQYDFIKNGYINNDDLLPLWYNDWEIGYVGTCCSFGGAWFNGYAAYNKKKKEDHVKEARNGLIKQINGFKYLASTTFKNMSYDEYDYPPKSVIYCDPPYADTKKYESDFDHIKFWNWVREMSSKGHYVYVSEYTAPSDFKCIWQKVKKDGMGSSRTGVSKTRIEKLFVYNGNICV